MGFRVSHFSTIYRSSHLTRRITSSSSSSSSSSSPTKFRLICLLSPINPLTDQPLPPLIFPKQPHHYIPIRTHFGHSHDHPHHSGHEPEYILKLGLASDIALAAAKGLAGYLSGSTAIIADAAHSVSDIVLSGVAWVSFRVARAPKDEEHPYGHGKFETLGALGISGMLLATAGGIGWHAIDILMGLLVPNSEVVNHSVSNGHAHHHGIDMDHPILALNVMIVSIAVKEGLYWITKKAGEKQGSGLMMANAWHHRADAVSSVVALIGVGGSILGVKFLDPLAGLYVSGLILKAGIETGYQSIMELVDAGVPMPLLDPIKQTILQVEGVMGCHRIRGRRAGSSVYLDVHIEVDPFSSVSAAHDIGENVRRDIQKSHAEVAEVFIHIDPSLSQLSPRLADDQAESRTGCDTSDVISHQKDVEAIVSEVLLSKFPTVVSVERIIHHSLQGKLIIQIEVSMPPDMLIQEAMHVAKEAEKEILKAASNLTGVSLQLRLGHPIPHFHQKM